MWPFGRVLAAYVSFLIANAECVWNRNLRRSENSGSESPFQVHEDSLETAPSPVTACGTVTRHGMWEEFWQPTFHFSLLMLSESEIVTYAGPKIPDRKVPFKCTKTRWRLHRHPSRHVAIWKNFDKSAVIGLEIRPLENMLWFGWATKQGDVNAAVDFSWNVKWVIYSSWKVIRPPAAWGELSMTSPDPRIPVLRSKICAAKSSRGSVSQRKEVWWSI